MTLFAFLLPALVLIIGTAIDYGSAAATRSKMQAVADSAAVAAVRELALARTNPDAVTAVANNLISTSLQDASPSITVDLQAQTVQIAISKQYTPVTGVLLSRASIPLTVSSTAMMSGSLPLCLLGLDSSAPETVGLEANALMTAPGCLVQSNSLSKLGLKSQNSAVLLAGMICSAGGKVNATSANFTPAPTTDCPVLPDPMASRPPPPVGACNYTAKVVDGINVTLQPGTYCLGLIVTNGANVTLMPGVYIFAGGPLVVDLGASLTGTGVGFYFSGALANLTFDEQSTINLSAATTGPLAGILIYDDPSGIPAPAIVPVSGRGALGRALKTGSLRQHQILSDNARLLLGTIYMPKGEIIVDAEQPIADKSAYTVLVVQQLHLYSGPNLIVNTNYSATNVPVPLGVGPTTAKVFITN